MQFHEYVKKLKNNLKKNVFKAKAAHSKAKCGIGKE
jgi:hypothetical protein